LTDLLREEIGVGRSHADFGQSFFQARDTLAKLVLGCRLGDQFESFRNGSIKSFGPTKFFKPFALTHFRQQFRDLFVSTFAEALKINESFDEFQEARGREAPKNWIGNFPK
jgi:hypothetical protein